VEEGFQEVVASRKPECLEPGFGMQLMKAFRTVVRQQVPFQVTPGVFVRVEFGSVRRQKFDVQSPVLRQKAFDFGAAMSRQAVPDQHDVSSPAT